MQDKSEPVVLSDEELIAVIQGTPADRVDVALWPRYCELVYGPPPTPKRKPVEERPAPPSCEGVPDWLLPPNVVARRQQQCERERRERIAAPPVPPSRIRLPRGRDRHAGRPPARRTQPSSCTARSRAPGDDSGSDLPPARPEAPSLFDRFMSITPGLEGSERLALFLRVVPEEAQQAFWTDLAAMSRRRWSA